MKRLHLLALSIVPFLFSACATSPESGILTEEISYEVDGVEMVGYLARPKNVESKTPGVLVVHEWWGQTAYPRERAEMLAHEGYIALAVDMYGERKIADHPKDAGAFSSAAMSNAPLAKKKFLAAKELLHIQEKVDPEKTAAIGYCFGGAVVLAMARAQVDLGLVGSFHGSLTTSTPAKKGTVKPYIAVYNGAADPMVKKSHILAFEKEMKNAGVDYRFKNYEGALHGFTNPAATENGKKFDLPLAYDATADEDSWNDFLQLMKTKL